MWQKTWQNSTRAKCCWEVFLSLLWSQRIQQQHVLRRPQQNEELIYLGHIWSRRASVCHFWLEEGNMAWKIQNTGIVESKYWLVRGVSGNVVRTQTPRMQVLPLSSSSQSVSQSHTPAITFNVSISRELNSPSPSLLPLTIPCSCGTLRSVLWRV